MDEIEFSMCITEYQDISPLSQLLKGFKRRCRVRTILWKDAPSELSNMAIYNRGADVSQVGAPTVGDLVSMNALRPFTPEEVYSIGGEQAFLPMAWESSRRIERQQVWAIPWLADPRAIFYWRDLLEHAGIEEEHAFQNSQEMEATLGRLQADSIPSPWVIPTIPDLPLLQIIASWVWGAGGDFVSPEGKRVRFLEPEALAGFKAFYRLFRFTPRTGSLTDIQQVKSQFTSRQAAVTMGSPQLGLSILKEIPAGERSLLGVAAPPGPSLIGGSNLVVWAHTRRPIQAGDLVRFLTSKAAQVEYLPSIGYLPVRWDAFTEPPYTTDPFFKGLLKTMYDSRPFSLIRMGGLLEARLLVPLSNIWQELIENPEANLDSILSDHLTPTANRLNVMLSSTAA